MSEIFFHIFFSLSIILLSLGRGESLSYYLPKIEAILPNEGFVQGLAYRDGFLYQSTGLYHRSRLKKIRASDGTVVLSRAIPQVFAEGLTIHGDRFFLLTWKAGKCFIYTPDMKKVDTWPLDREGWGLAAGKRGFWLSDGSSTLFLRSFEDFSLMRTVHVSLFGRSLFHLNEMEYVEGQLYINIWKEDFLVIFDIESSAVSGVVDCRSLVDREKRFRNSSSLLERKQNLLNGIAFDSNRRLFYLTGKRWQHIYVVHLVQAGKKAQESIEEYILEGG